MKFALQDGLIGATSHLETFTQVKELGYDAVELNLFQKVVEENYALEAMEASETTGIPISAISGGYRGWIGHFDEETRNQAVADIVESMRLGAQMGANGLIAPAAWGMFSRRLPPHQPPRDEEGDRHVLTDSIKRIAEAAERYQITFYFEPLNRYEDHMVNTVGKAVSIAREINSCRVKILGDFFHMNIEETDISKTIVTYQTYLGYFHLADSNRLLPGKGHIDFVSSFRKLKELAFSGYLSLECRVGEERRNELIQTVRFLRGLINDEEGLS